MNKHVCVLLRFLISSKGTWRNSVFITCEDCNYGISSRCHGYLFTPDSDGKPIIIPVEAIHKAFGVFPDKEDCQAVFSLQQFQAIYSHWLDWTINDSTACPLLQIKEESNSMCGENSDLCVLSV